MNFEGDVLRARRLLPLVEEGFAASLTEAATRFAISIQRWHHPGRHRNTATV